MPDAHDTPSWTHEVDGHYSCGPVVLTSLAVSPRGVVLTPWAITVTQRDMAQRRLFTRDGVRPYLLTYPTSWSAMRWAKANWEMLLAYAALTGDGWDGFIDKRRMVPVEAQHEVLQPRPPDPASSSTRRKLLWQVRDVLARLPADARTGDVLDIETALDAHLRAEHCDTPRRDDVKPDGVVTHAAQALELVEALRARVAALEAVIKTTIDAFPLCLWCGVGTTTYRDINGVQPCCDSCNRPMEFPVARTADVDLDPLRQSVDGGTAALDAALATARAEERARLRARLEGLGSRWTMEPHEGTSLKTDWMQRHEVFAAIDAKPEAEAIEAARAHDRARRVKGG